MSTEITYQDINNRRSILGEILPLEMPLGITIQVTNLCNFKCFYCSASQSPAKRIEDGQILKHMPYQDYRACIDSIAHSGSGKIKILNLCGFGEPLLHPDIVRMVKYAKAADIAEQIKILSNGSLLTYEMSDALIDAGLSNIRISLQGLDAKAYKDTSQINLDFEQFVENIRYFYEHRKNSSISLRIMDHMIRGKEDEFKRIFSGICNDYIVGSLIEVAKNVDVTNHGSDLNKNFSGDSLFETSICASSFFRAHIDVDCRLMPCCMVPLPCKFGDVRESFYKVWNSKEHLSFCLGKLLNNDNYEVCKICKLYAKWIEETDKLDDYRDDLIAKYSELLKSAEAETECRHE